jgi:hypothetical protein
MIKVNLEKFKTVLLVTALMLASACSSQSAEILNPFAETPEVELGVRNNSAIAGDADDVTNADKARAALVQMGEYQKALPAQPYKPVIQPAEVRLMWVPDHINKAGDLIPAHYYYLKLLPDRWAVSDSFELLDQLDNAAGGSAASGGATPWTYKQGR